MGAETTELTMASVENPYSDESDIHMQNDVEGDDSVISVEADGQGTLSYSVEFCVVTGSLHRLVKKTEDI